MPHHQLRHETKHIKFQIVLLLEKIQMLQKKVKLLLEQLQVCIFAKKNFRGLCTLIPWVLTDQLSLSTSLPCLSKPFPLSFSKVL